MKKCILRVFTFIIILEKYPHINIRLILVLKICADKLVQMLLISITELQ